MMSAIFSGMHRHTRPAAYADKRGAQHSGSFRPGAQGFTFTGEFPDVLSTRPVDATGQRRRYAAGAGVQGTYQPVGEMDTGRLPAVSRYGVKLVPALALLVITAALMACGVLMVRAEGTKTAKLIAAQESQIQALSQEAGETVNAIALHSNDVNIRQEARRMGMINARSSTVEYLSVPEDAVIGPGTVNGTEDLASVW